MGATREETRTAGELPGEVCTKESEQYSAPEIRAGRRRRVQQVNRSRQVKHEHCRAELWVKARVKSFLRKETSGIRTQERRILGKRLAR